MREYTYLAGDWDHDKKLVEKIQEWNESPYKDLKFKDVHKLTQSKDESLNCSIKASLGKRMDLSHTFVLIVGNYTSSVKAGSCVYCAGYYNNRCYHGYSPSFENFIEYECKKAVNDGLRIIVIYNSNKIDRMKCPEIIRYKGIHIVAYYYFGNECCWNYQEIKNSIMGY